MRYVMSKVYLKKYNKRQEACLRKQKQDYK